jgi:biopolymer transport protein ExbD
MAFSARYDSAPISDINVTPLVDVLLVLLIIFMISAPVIAHKSSLSFPVGDKASVSTPDPIRVAIDPDGSIFWNGSLVTDAALSQQMMLAGKAKLPPALDIAAADGASYEIVAHVLAEAKVQGLERVEFVER